MHTAPLAEQIAGVATLADPVRRSLYLYVVGRPAEVGRDEAARAVKISRALAAFHLDKLVGAGLLETTYRRLTKRRGPGAGRPAKLYRRSPRQFSVSLPPRDYELCAQLLAAGFGGSGTATPAGVTRTARRFGHDLAAGARQRVGGNASQDRLLRAAEELLGELGFEPERRGGREIRLRNCPFEALTRQHDAVVCGMALGMIEGAVARLGLKGVKVVGDPQPGLCCLALERRRARRPE